MNNIINNIINQQKFIQLNDIDPNLIILDEEDALVMIDNQNVTFRAQNNLSDALKYRLSLVMPYIISFANKYNKPRLQFIFSLGDLLKTQYNNFPVICFSKRKNIDGVLIPNIDFFTGAMYSFLKESNDDIDYNLKNNSSIFIGSSTGPFVSNTRILYGKKCLESTNNHKCIVNNLCQADRNAWIAEYPWILNLLGQSQNIKNQLSNKLVINIDGNTLCWSRLYWQMNSNSIPVYINKSKTDIQFFDYIDSSDAYVTCSLDDSIDILDNILEKYSSQQIKDINLSGKNFCNKCFSDYLQDPKMFLQNIINEIFFRLTNTL